MIMLHTSWPDPSGPAMGTFGAKARRVGRRFRRWGLRGAAGSFGTGAAEAFGFFRQGGTGPMKFIGGRALAGWGIGAGVGYGVYKMTDNPLLGIGAGIGATAAATKAISGRFFAGGLKAAIPLFTALSVFEGIREGGFSGGVKAAATEAAIFGAFHFVPKAASVAFGGAGGALGTHFAGATSFIKGAGRFLFNPMTLIVAGLGFGAYKGAQALASFGRKSMATEFAGDMSSFLTEGAYSMRSRALQEINRSHTNSRTVLGNEASLMHL